MNIKVLNEYSEETANRVRELLIQLSRSSKDRGEIPKEWFDNLIVFVPFIEIWGVMLTAMIKPLSFFFTYYTGAH